MVGHVKVILVDSNLFVFLCQPRKGSVFVVVGFSLIFSPEMVKFSFAAFFEGISSFLPSKCPKKKPAAFYYVDSVFSLLFLFCDLLNVIIDSLCL